MNIHKNPLSSPHADWGLEEMRKLGWEPYECDTTLPEGFTAVDAHIHLFPEKMFQAIWEWFDACGWKVLFKHPIPELLAYLRNMGVTRSACLVYAHRAGVAAGLNRWIAELAAREPEVIPFGAFHQDDPPAVLDEALGPLALKGIKIHCNVQQCRASDPRFFPLYEKLLAAGRTLVIHAGTKPLQDEWVGLDHLRRVLERYPTLSVQVAHMGAAEFEKAFALLADFPNVTLDTSIIFNDRLPFFPDARHEDVIRFADRILYGSDFPNIWYPPEAGAAAFLARNFPNDVNRKILHENANRIFG